MIQQLKRGAVILAGTATLLFASGVAHAVVCTDDPATSSVQNCNVLNVADLNQVFALAENDTLHGSFSARLAPGTYMLTQPLKHTKGADVEVLGATTLAGAPTYVLDGSAITGANKRVIFVDGRQPDGSFGGPLVSVSGVTVQNGSNLDEGIGRGGCIIAVYGYVALYEDIIQGCKSTGLGGAIDADGGSQVQIWSSVLKNNAIGNALNNKCGGGAFTAGGALAVVAGGAAYVSNSSLIGNQACRAGAIDVEGGTLNLSNSTVAKNIGVSRAGAIRVLGSSSSIDLEYDTIVENRGATRSCGGSCSGDPNGSGGLMFESFTGGHTRLIGNIISNNTVDFLNGSAVTGTAALRDCDATNTTFNKTLNSPTFAYGTNLFGFAGTCNFTLGWWGLSVRPANLAALGLSPLADIPMASSVGGTMPAYKPLTGAMFLGHVGRHSALANGGTVDAQCLEDDQRKYTRNDYVSPMQCDVGAYELKGKP